MINVVKCFIFLQKNRFSVVPAEVWHALLSNVTLSPYMFVVFFLVVLPCLPFSIVFVHSGIQMHKEVDIFVHPNLRVLNKSRSNSR